MSRTYFFPKRQHLHSVTPQTCCFLLPNAHWFCRLSSHHSPLTHFPYFHFSFPVCALSCGTISSYSLLTQPNPSSLSSPLYPPPPSLLTKIPLLSFSQISTLARRTSAFPTTPPVLFFSDTLFYLLPSSSTLPGACATRWHQREKKIKTPNIWVTKLVPKPGSEVYAAV